MRSFIKEITWIERNDKYMNFGWGNGYVVIPKGHPLYGIDYDDIDLDVHYGITYSNYASKENWEEVTQEERDNDCWIIGFDTIHLGDTLEKWPKEKVQEEADYLLEQVKIYK
mgnify:CR=1 FL=1